MRLLYFASVDFYQKPNPSFHLMTTMISDLMENGFEIEFVGCAVDGLEKHIPDEFIHNPNFNYTLISVPNTPKRSFSKRYIDGIVYAGKAKRIIKKVVNTCDCVFIQSSPTALYNILAVKHVSRSIPLIYNIQDMFPGSSIASGVMKSKWMQKIFFRLQKMAYRKSDVIVVISEDMKAKLLTQGVPEEKIRVIVNWFDDRQIHEIPWEENEFVKEFNMNPNTFYVQYAGTMGYVFDYTIVVEIAEKLKNRKEIVFQMIGEGSQKDDFVNLVKQKRLDNIWFLPLQPLERVSQVYSACSVCLIPLKKGIIGNSVPSKAGVLMACKRAIISVADKGSDYNKMINQNGIGFAFDHTEMNRIVESLLYLQQNRDVSRQLGIAGYEYGHQLYSRSNNIKKYIQLFKECVS